VQQLAFFSRLFFFSGGIRDTRARRSSRLARCLFPFDDLHFSPWVVYNRAKVLPPAGEYFVSALSRAWAA
jgi:hypothetical protein